MAHVLNNGDVMKIRISRLSNGLHEYHFSSDPSEIGLENNFKKTIEVDVTLDKTSRQMYLKSDIRSSGFFQCDRCLTEFEQPVSCHFNMFYMYNDLDAGGHPADEVQVISSDTVYIDLTEDVRQMVTLTVPLKLLCRDDCKGLCPRCGINWNHQSCRCNLEMDNSRWEGLKDAMNK
jgi:uncharacterized protein